MAGNSIEFRVVVNADGLVTGMKQVTNFGNETQKTGKKAKAAGDEVSRLNYTMNQGVVGASSAARSFSKLNQSIGSGNGGLVGAYATLAANAFAVSAAFNGLREASQVEQLMQGLEFQGAKTGRTLSTVATSIQEITEGSLSAADAMKATALASSAGLAASDIEKLTLVATNASKVLGRNLPDSMDRIIKGVTKLEPELLDELGLMTKLTEASAAYARQQGKSASALTNFEKRRAFVEAIQREGELKFAGVEEAVDVNRYDQLAATFRDLVTTSLSWVNSLTPIQGILKTLTESTFGMAGALLLFASSIRKQLLGTFVDIVARAGAAAKETKRISDDLRKTANQNLKASRDQLKTTAQDLKTAASLSVKAPTTFKDNVASMVAGAASAESYKKTIDSLTRSIKYYELQERKKSGTAKVAAGEEAEANRQRLEAVNAMKDAQEKASKSEAANRVATLNARVSQRAAVREEARAASLSAISSGNLREAYNQAFRSLGAYNAQQRLTLQATAASAQAAGRAIPTWTALQLRFQFIGAAAMFARTGIAALTIGIQALGVAIVSLLSVVGILFSLYSIGQMVYKKYFETEADRQKKKALEELGQVLESTTAKNKEYNRVLEAEINAGTRSIKANIIKANTILELSNSYLALADAALAVAKAEAEADKIRSVSGSEYAGMTPQQRREAEQKGSDKSELVKAGVRAESPLLDAVAGKIDKSFFNTLDEAQVKQILSLDAIIAKYPNAEAAILKAINASEKWSDSVAKTAPIVRASAPIQQKLSDSYSELESNLMGLQQAQSTFSNSLKVTTPYDDISNKLNAVRVSFKATTEAARLAGEPIDVAKFTAIPEEVSRTFSVTTQRAIESFSIVDLQIQKLKNSLKDIDKSSPEFKGVSANITALTKQKLAIQSTLIPELDKELNKREEIMHNMRLQSMTHQSQVSLAQAQLSVFQRQGIVVSADLKEQIRQQNRIIDIQILQEKAQINLLESEKASLKLDEEKIRFREKLLKLSLEEQKVSLERQITSATAGSDEQIKAVSNLAIVNAELAKSSDVQRQVEVKADKAAIRRATELADAQIKSRKNALAALAAGKIGSVEEGAQLTKLDIANARTLAGLTQETAQFTVDRQLAEANLNSLRSGGLSFLDKEIKGIKDSADLRISAAKRETAFKVADFQADIDKAKQTRGVNSEQLLFLTSQRDLTQKRGEQEVALLEVQKEVSILEKIGIKNQADALQILQQSLDLYQRRVDLAREVADQESQISRNAAEIRVLETGGQVDERTRLAFENEAAQIALQAAIQERDLKLQVIDVEYKLLEAQRAQTLAQLTLQEAALRNLKTAEGDALANTLAKARSNIMDVDMTAIQELQTRQAKNTVILAEQTAKKAGLAFRNSFFPQNSTITAFTNLGERMASRRRAATPTTTPDNIPTGNVDAATKYYQESIKKLKGNFGELKSVATLTFSDIADVINTGAGESLKQFEQLSAQASERLGQDFGPEGKIFTSLIGLTQVLSVTLPNTFKVLTTSFEEFKTKNAEALEGVKADTQKTIYTAQQLSAAFSAAAQVISGIASLIKSISDAKIAGVDKEIAAEQKRDGKSAESVSKIEAMESKKDSIAKKSFNTQKKLMLAQAVMSTAAAVAGAYASLAMLPVVGPTLAAIAAGIIGAAGLAQIAIISGMQYGGGGAKTAAAPPSTLSIGKRSDSVDLARGPSASAGGEVGFIRGSQGMGTNASNFRTIGSAYGGDLMRGYGNRGFVVGEKGPEIITPETPINVTPANDAMAATPVNATFNIQALDASGVQDILVSQKGNIIKMIRDAANASGQGFLEDVNVNVYTRPSVNKL